MSARSHERPGVDHRSLPSARGDSQRDASPIRGERDRCRRHLALVSGAAATDDYLRANAMTGPYVQQTLGADVGIVAIEVGYVADDDRKPVRCDDDLRMALDAAFVLTHVAKHYGDRIAT